MRRWWQAPLLLALFAVSAMVGGRFVTPISAHQHVANGGFESGMQRWSATGASGSIAEAQETSPAQGASTIRLTLSSQRAQLRQSLAGALAAGSYVASLQARSDDGATIRLIVETAGGERVQFEDAVSPGPWSTIGGTVHLSQAAHASLTIEVDGAAGDTAYLDDVRLDGAPPVTLTPTPAPASPTPVQPTAAAPTVEATPTVAVAVDTITPSLRNAGFEQDDGAGAPFAWERYGGSLAISTSPVRSGRAAARLESSSDSTKWMHQAVLVQPGTGYEFSAWLHADDANVASAFLRISWYESGDASGSAIGSVDSTSRLDAAVPGYRSLSTGGVYAPATARSARVRIMMAPRSGNRAAIYVDDASFGPAIVVPTPESQATLPAEAGEPSTNSAAGRSSASTSSRPATRVIRTSSTSARPPVVRVAGISSAGSEARVVINEVLYDPAAADDAASEWIELYNAGSAPLDVAGWTIGDAISGDVLPPALLAPGAFVIVAASDSFFQNHPGVTVDVIVLGGRIGNGLGNNGDVVGLADGTGVLVDAVSWGDESSAFVPPIADVPEGHSVERRTVGTDTDQATDFLDNERPSPGVPYVSPQLASDAGAGRTVQVLDGASDADLSWLPWAMAALSAAALTGVLGWRFVDAIRRRPPLS